jgi:hypothetical protein
MITRRNLLKNLTGLAVIAALGCRANPRRQPQHADATSIRKRTVHVDIGEGLSPGKRASVSMADVVSITIDKDNHLCLEHVSGQINKIAGCLWVYYRCLPEGSETCSSPQFNMKRKSSGRINYAAIKQVVDSSRLNLGSRLDLS